MAYDIIIKGGTVIDGTGKEAFRADIGIKGKYISYIGPVVHEAAPLVIDAANKYVVPGFIDTTNHSDTHLTIFKYPHQESMIMQGVTTIMGGSCGASLAPLVSHVSIGAIKRWANPEEININWNTVDEFLREVALLRLGVNFGTLIGYGTIRRGVIGEMPHVLSLEEREKIKFLLKEGVHQGGFGLSLGLAYGHERSSSTEEILDIVSALRGTNSIVSMHLRSEGIGIIAAINEAVRISSETETAVHVNHFKVIGRRAWPLSEKALEMMARARAAGVSVTIDVSPHPTTGSLLYLLTPPWARTGGFAELFKRIDDSTERKKILTALREHTLHYDTMLVISAKLKMVVGHTIAEIAARMGLDPEEAVLELIRANEGRIKILGRTVLQKNVDTAIGADFAFVASDGEGYNMDELNTGSLVHPRSFGAFTHFWHRYVVDLKSFTPERAIQKMTGDPAMRFGIKERGALRNGYRADIVVFDPRLFRDRATYRHPFRYSAGIEWVLVNGAVAVREGMYQGVRAGEVIRKT